MAQRWRSGMMTSRGYRTEPWGTPNVSLWGLKQSRAMWTNPVLVMPLEESLLTVLRQKKGRKTEVLFWKHCEATLAWSIKDQHSNNYRGGKKRLDLSLVLFVTGKKVIRLAVITFYDLNKWYHISMQMFSLRRVYLCRVAQIRTHLISRMTFRLTFFFQLGAIWIWQL